MPGIDYRIRLSPAVHEIEVTASIAAPGDTLELFLPVWTPGSYLVREYSRHVLAVSAAGPDGEALTVRKTAKNRWRVDGAASAPQVVVRYRLYAREMSVRTNFVDDEFALVVGAATFLTTPDRLNLPHTVQIDLPLGWTSHTALPAASHALGRYEAPDYDTLVDSPIAAGRTVSTTFLAGGRPHEVVDVGDTTAWDGNRAARDVETIVAAQHGFWGSVPYERYVFLNVVSEGWGGLEHRSSTVLMTSRWKTRTRKTYLEWLRLASHEFFHTWNVKRLRPVELGPFEYERENHTRALWIAEGVTEYYGDLMVRRAGLCSDGEYLDELGAQIDQVQSTPGRLVQPLALASFDAWIKHYRPDENSLNAAMSYYTKGCVVAFLLDVEIQRASDGMRSLDDVMRAAFERYSGERGYGEHEFRDLASQIAGTDLGPWLGHAVDTVEELDYAPALDWLGVRLRRDEPAAGHPVKAYLGVATRSDAGRLVVTSVRASSPAASAGVSPDDEIVAVGGYRVKADQLESRLEAYAPSERVSLVVARRERLLELDLTLGEAPRPLKLDVDPAATAGQQARRARWLAG